MYTKVEEAVKFATKAHQGQKRKDGVDFICHPLTCGMMLQNEGYSDEVVIVAILHDVIEDTSYTYNEIANKFGVTIADTVRTLSEDPKIKDYKLRKSAFMEQIKILDKDMLMVECVDKLHNLLYDFDINNDSLKDYSEHRKWFYFEMQKMINKKCSGTLVDRLNEMIEFLK